MKIAHVALKGAWDHLKATNYEYFAPSGAKTVEQSLDERDQRTT